LEGNTVIIAVDAMGGDHAPGEIVKGTVQAAALMDIEVILVGDSARLETELLKHQGPQDKIKIQHAGQVVGMDEHPALALKNKKDASISVATQLVKGKKADALVSCGNTGAQMAAALLVLGRMKGIERPAIATLLPGKTGPTVLLDVGANVDVKPTHLVQFALMGSAYGEIALGKPQPCVGLLSNGEEETKGNQVTITTHSELKSRAGLNFIGNVEGRDFFNGRVDVVVCDGFIGNIIIKTMEGFTSWMMERLSAQGVEQARDMFKDLDYSQIGGAPLLGVEGVSIVCHGSSKSQAVVNGIRMAQKSVEADIVSRLHKILND
jgi:glycerol-3-phosphate acyltransferase PlsX